MRGFKAINREGVAVRWLGLSLVAATLLLAGCTAGPSNRPEIVVIEDGGQQPPQPSGPSAPPLPPLEEPRGATVRWSPCQDNITRRLTTPALPTWLTLECGRVQTPLDSPYAPGRGNIRMQVLRAGKGPIPIVVVNDVGGQPGTIYAARLAASLPQDFFARFSLVGVDRRGTGNSEPPNCVPKDIRETLVGIDPQTDPVTDWLEPAKTAGQQCSIELESRLPALDTFRTTADLENVRVALGMPRLNAIGHGEGSRVLGVYAERFGDRVGRFVLDGVPDMTADDVPRLEGVAAGAEATWQAFAADCLARNCELGPDPHQALPALLTELRKAPITTPTEFTFAAGVGQRAVLAGLADRANWPALSAAIAKARDAHDGAGLAALMEPIVLDTDDQAPLLDAELVIGCNDTKTRIPAEQLTTIAQDWNKKYPMFGALVAQRLSLCGPWPVQTQPLPSPTAKNAPPIVVIGTASDPITPLQGTERTAHQLDNGVLVSWQGAGHGALGLSGCATEAAQLFFTDGKVPRDGTACPP
jgi:pimeloyl-ACP methyl ester carboxylesterase